MKRAHFKIFSMMLCILMLFSMCISSSYAMDTAYTMETNSYKNGFSFGSQNKAEIAQNISAMKEKATENKISLKKLLKDAKEVDEFYKEMLPEKVEWMHGVADSTSIPYEDILILNTFDKKMVGFEGECTTFLAQGKALASGQGTMIMKNRDQGANALCEISVKEPATYGNGAIYRAAYIDIPQAEKTYKVVANRTAGRWGYGMGINEHQVIVADNDAPSRDILDFKAGLHDNDVVRLLLERAKTAREAVDILGKIVEKYGQAWNGIMFEIGDPNELWVVEVTGHRWVAKKYNDTISARSNQYQIEDDYDLCSADLISFAIEQGWVDEGTEKINFRKVYSCDVGYPDDNDLSKRKNVEKLYNTEMRYERAMELLKENEGNITYSMMMNGARDHYDTYTLPSGKVIELNQVPFYSTEYADWENKEFLNEAPNSDETPAHMYVRGVCGHDIGWGRTIASAVLIARPNVPNELGLMLHALGTPCKSVYVPFYVGIDKVHPDFENPTAAVLFKAIDTRTFGFYNMYHDAMRKHFDKYEENMLNSLAEIEKQFISVQNKDEAKQLLTDFVINKCDEALKTGKAVQQEITNVAKDWYSWEPRDINN
ncbi:C69 family dipeptidase [Anaeromicrobium sediminis]|uniref:Dipeptidase n=1 Tax=Anaeromicrobium sediminis TaxID=1478221 RepID=A0A267MJ93_9FIRM|nr:C69 family dipeptidase [Anaeromicrobium sediminis]PAB59596.1 hypothetical protein CCE28_08465 [Anaeromicrobium sediminis]